MQAALIKPVAFKTTVFKLDTNMVIVYQHPTSTNPALPMYSLRCALMKGPG